MFPLRLAFLCFSILGETNFPRIYSYKRLNIGLAIFKYTQVLQLNAIYHDSQQVLNGKLFRQLNCQCIPLKALQYIQGLWFLLVTFPINTDQKQIKMCTILKKTICQLVYSDKKCIHIQPFENCHYLSSRSYTC